MTKVDAKAATLYADGNEAYWECACGQLFADGGETYGDPIDAIPVTPMLTTVATIGDVRYATLEEAMAAATKGETVVLQATANVSSTITVAAGSTTVLDLNGQTVAMGTYHIVVNGNLTVVDQTGKGKVCNDHNNFLIEVTGSGRLDISGGTYENSTRSGKQANGIYINGTNASATIDGATIHTTTTDTSRAYGVRVTAGTAVITNCYIYGVYDTSPASGVYSKGTTTVSNTKIEIESSYNSNPYGIEVQGGTVTLGEGNDVKVNYDREGEDKRDSSAIFVTGTGNVTINGGTYAMDATAGTSVVRCYNTNASVTINGGTFIAEGDTSNAATLRPSAGTINIHGGSFEAKNIVYAATNEGTLNIYGGTFEDTNSASVDVTAYYHANVLADVKTSGVDNVVTVCDEIADMTGAVTADGNAVIALRKDVTATGTTEFSYSFTLDLNDFTWNAERDPNTESGNVLRIKAVGTENAVTKIQNGKIAGLGRTHAVRLDNGALQMTDVCATSYGATVGYFTTDTQYNELNRIENCQFLSTAFAGFSFNNSAGQTGVQFTFKDSLIVAPTARAFAEQGANTGTIVLEGNIHLYTIAGSGAAGTDGITLSPAMAKTADGVAYTFEGTEYTNLRLYAMGHAGATLTEKVDATCTEAGNVAYYTCPTCKLNFSDEACTQVLESTVIDAKDHAYPEQWTDTGDGSNHQKVCANDPTHILTEAHTYGE